MKLQLLNRGLGGVMVGALLGLVACGDPSPGGQKTIASKHIVVLTRDNFQAEVEASALPVVVDFWAAWCGPCRRLSPMVAEMADEFHTTVKTGKVNVDEQRALAQRFAIQSIPTLLIFKGGKQVDQIVGLPGKDALRQKYQALSGKP